MRDVLEKHYRKNYKKLCALARRRLKDLNDLLPEEAVQEAYARALKYENSFDPTQNEFATWFGTIFINTIKDIKKIERMKGINEDVDVEEMEAVFFDTSSLLAKHINEEIENKKEPVRFVLKLFFFKGYSARDIAYVSVYSYANVRKILSRFCRDVEVKYG